MSILEFVEMEVLFMVFKLLSSNVLEDMSLVGLSLADLPSSESIANGLTGGMAPDREEGGIKLFWIENPGRVLLAFSPETEDWCKCEDPWCIDNGCVCPCKWLLWIGENLPSGLLADPIDIMNIL